MRRDEEVERIVHTIKMLMACGINPTFQWLLAKAPFIYTRSQLRRVLARGRKSGRLVGPGRGGRSGWRYRSAPW